jgi:hypothetical protein
MNARPGQSAAAAHLGPLGAAPWQGAGGREDTPPPAGSQEWPSSSAGVDSSTEACRSG